MQFFSLALLAVSAAAVSLPRQELTSALSGTGLNGLTTGQAAAKCGNGQVLACCNQGSTSSDGSLIGGLGQNLIGGNCDQVPINIIGANGILLDTCQSNVAACCTAEEDSLANVSCDPIIG